MMKKSQECTSFRKATVKSWWGTSTERYLCKIRLCKCWVQAPTLERSPCFSIVKGRRVLLLRTTALLRSWRRRSSKRFLTSTLSLSRSCGSGSTSTTILWSCFSRKPWMKSHTCARPRLNWLIKSCTRSRKWPLRRTATSSKWTKSLRRSTSSSRELSRSRASCKKRSSSSTSSTGAQS
jgi:hypothetical protein